MRDCRVPLCWVSNGNMWKTAFPIFRRLWCFCCHSKSRERPIEINVTQSNFVMCVASHWMKVDSRQNLKTCMKIIKTVHCVVTPVDSSRHACSEDSLWRANPLLRHLHPEQTVLLRETTVLAKQLPVVSTVSHGLARVVLKIKCKGMLNLHSYESLHVTTGQLGSCPQTTPHKLRETWKWAGFEKAEQLCDSGTGQLVQTSEPRLKPELPCHSKGVFSLGLSLFCSWYTRFFHLNDRVPILFLTQS